MKVNWKEASQEDAALRGKISRLFNELIRSTLETLFCASITVNMKKAHWFLLEEEKVTFYAAFEEKVTTS